MRTYILWLILNYIFWFLSKNWFFETATSFPPKFSGETWSATFKMTDKATGCVVNKDNWWILERQVYVCSISDRLGQGKKFRCNSALK